MRILVFDIGGTAIKYGICENGQLTDTSEVPTQAHLGGRHIMDTVIGLIERENSRKAPNRACSGGVSPAAGQASIGSGRSEASACHDLRAGFRFDGIGVSTAGQVNSEEGSIIYANENIPDYTGFQIRRELESRFHVPVAVENDVNSAAIGEAVYGGGKEIPSFLCLTYGTGIGGAIVENGAIYHGSGYSAAEFGSIVTHADAKIAGRTFMDGCYERYASAAALVNAAIKYDPRLSDGRKIFAALDDPQVVHILDGWIDEVLCGLSSVIHIFNPSCVILGGGIMSQPLIFEKIAARRRHFIMPSFDHVQIRPALLGNRAGMLGIYYLTEEIIRKRLSI